jgi:hypothetical protein
MKISRYFRDGLLATDRLERHRAFPGRRNAVCRDLLDTLTVLDLSHGEGRCAIKQRQECGHEFHDPLGKSVIV